MEDLQKLNRTCNALLDHYEEGKTLFPFSNIVGIFLCGSQNYDLDTETSDVDTKLVVTPSIADTALRANPASRTHVRQNDEHIEVKDVRLMVNCFRKQNINFIETLFTKYYLCNPLYAGQWYRLVTEKESIARYNPYAAAQTILGMARTKREQLTHDFPTRHHLIEKFGYDPKQLMHLMRMSEFFDKYAREYPYAECLHSDSRSALLEIKSGVLPLNRAVSLADLALSNLQSAVSAFCARTPAYADKHVETLLRDVEIEIIKLSFKQELANENK